MRMLIPSNMRISRSMMCKLCLSLYQLLRNTQVLLHLESAPSARLADLCLWLASMSWPTAQSISTLRSFFFNKNVRTTQRQSVLHDRRLFGLSFVQSFQHPFIRIVVQQICLHVNHRNSIFVQFLRLANLYSFKRGMIFAIPLTMFESIFFNSVLLVRKSNQEWSKQSMLAA